MGSENDLVGQVMEGRVISVDSDFALIDVGLKSEGRVLLKEFAPPGQKAEIAVGDTVEVFLERMENKNGEAVLSREKARREEAWTQLEKAFEKTERVNGVIFGRVKGGFTVDLQGAVAFLPGSQVDIRPVRDVTPLMGTPQPFQILKMESYPRQVPKASFARRVQKQLFFVFLHQTNRILETYQPTLGYAVISESLPCIGS